MESWTKVPTVPTTTGVFFLTVTPVLRKMGNIVPFPFDSFSMFCSSWFTLRPALTVTKLCCKMFSFLTFAYFTNRGQSGSQLTNRLDRLWHRSTTAPDHHHRQLLTPRFTRSCSPYHHFLTGKGVKHITPPYSVHSTDKSRSSARTSADPRAVHWRR